MCPKPKHHSIFRKVNEIIRFMSKKIPARRRGFQLFQMEKHYFIFDYC